MTILKTQTQVLLVRRGEVTVRPSNYLTTGGEGSVYRLNDTIIKLYTDSNKMLRDGMSDKIKALSAINHPQIVAPIGPVKLRGKEVGYYMSYVDGEPLSRMFTNDFIMRHGVTLSDTASVVRSMRDIMVAAHKGGAILVDANELNWLVQIKKGYSPVPYIIDVDSWAIDRWKATVIMPSIQDVHAKLYDEKSDWFSWGVVTFQLFTGIHPYKGAIDGYARGDMKKRMQDNASVFSSKVRLNHAVRDFSLIPKGLLHWYKEVFEDGKRNAPPLDFDTVSKGTTLPQCIQRIIVSTDGKLIYSKLFDADGENIITIFPSGILLLGNGTLVHLALRREIGKVTTRDIELIEVEEGYILASKQHGRTACTFIDKNNFVHEVVEFPYEVKKFVRFENRLFGVAPSGLVEFSFHKFSKVIASVKMTWDVLSESTLWLPGFGLQNSLGAIYLIFPHDNAACSYLRIKELDSVSVMEGVRGKRSFSVTGLTRNGESKRYDFSLDKEIKSYTCKETDVGNFDIAEVSLPKGLRISIVEDGKLEASTPLGDKVVRIEDKDIATDGKLYHRGDTVLYARKGFVWSISMK